MNFATPLKSEDLPASRPNPQKRNDLIVRLARAPWWLLVILGMVLAFIVAVEDSIIYKNAWGQVRQGIWITIWVTLVAYTLACIIGLTVAILRRPSRSLVYTILVYQPITFYVELVRGIPTLVLIYYIVLALVPQMVTLGNEAGAWLVDQHINPFGASVYFAELKTRDVPNTYRAILALAVSYSAFLSEIFRAGLESVDIGQREAARSLGMSSGQVMRYVVLPQAIRNVLPPLGNDFIAMLKESSLVSVVGVADITRQGRDFSASTFTVFPGYNLITVTYLVMTLGLSMLVKGIELYADRSRREE